MDHDGRIRRNPKLWPTRLQAIPLGAVALLVVVLGMALGLRDPQPTRPLLPAFEPIPSEAAPSPNFLKILGKGRTLQDALDAYGIRVEQATEIIRALRPHLDFRRLRPTDSVEFHRDADGAVRRILYRQSPIDVWEAFRDEDVWRAGRLEVPVDHRLALVEGTLETSLFESIESLGEPAQLVVDFAEIFAWDFDFASDAQPGDRFRMLVEKTYADGQFVRNGRILLAEYESEGRVHTGVYFRDAEGGGYYTPDGESMRRAFLRSPLEFTRISSGYTRARRHPVLGGVRPHLAVDYAAPRGTPVWAVADGTVEFAGVRGGNGNTVVLRHRANFKTMYNHLSRFGPGIRKGVAVGQRRVIGYVGSTGLSTGPHLDYRVMKDGVFVNPLKHTFVPGRPLSGAVRRAFAEHRDLLAGKLRAAMLAQHDAPSVSTSPGP
jgi:murein DD-endopeptidase MepM/ murein hydrolase activator NlpD